MRTIILDEADMMLNLGFKEDIEWVTISLIMFGLDHVKDSLTM
jgi:superfamily II DNA/RNA helicase